MSATVPAPTSRNSTVTREAATAGRSPRRSSQRVGGQVSVVSSRPTIRGQTTDHIRPSSQRATPVATRTSSSSPEMRAEVRSAARVLPAFSEADMVAPYGARASVVIAGRKGRVPTGRRVRRARPEGRPDTAREARSVQRVERQGRPAKAYAFPSAMCAWTIRA